jgi:hypothetical protein
MVHLQKDTNYELVELEIRKGVIVDGDMLGMMPQLNYVDHDTIDDKKLLYLVPNKYFKRHISEKTHMIMIEPQIWVTRL